MKPAEYWVKRSEQVLLAAEKQGAELNRSLVEFYSETGRQIQRDIDAFFGRYASDNSISIQEAQKRLTESELKRFQEEMRFYLSETKRLGLDKNHEEYLRSLAGRTYISRQQELLAQVKHQVETLSGRTSSAFSSTIGSVYNDSYYRSIFYMQQGVGFGSDFARMDTKTVEALIKKPWLGDNYSSRIWQNKARLLQQLEQTIPQAFALGQNSRVLGEQIASRLGVSRSAGERLARTEVNHAANEAAKRAYQETGVTEYEYLATLDNRTSEICAALDGMMFRVADAVPGVNYPPMHPNCRSTIIPYFQPDEFDEPSSRAARDLSGKYYTVPANMTYPQWYDKQVEQYGKKAVETAALKERNLSSDLGQHQRYKAVLGNSVPSDPGAFQDMKYADGPMWEFARLDYRRQNRLFRDPSLKLPGAEKAMAADAKFTGYLFNKSNPQGYAKGVAFADRLGYTDSNWTLLQKEIMARVSRYPAAFKGSNPYGQLYEQRMVLYGLKNTPANVVVGWIVQDGQTRMTSCYIKEV